MVSIFRLGLSLPWLDVSQEIIAFRKCYFLLQTDLSSNSVRLTWSQQPIVHQFKVKLINFGLEKVFDVRRDGWSQELTSVSLEGGTQYDFEVIPVSYGLEGDSLVVQASTYPEAPVENRAARTFDSTSLDIEVNYIGIVEVKLGDISFDAFSDIKIIN